MGISYVCKYAERACLCNHNNRFRNSLRNHSIPFAIEWMVSLFVLVIVDIRTTMVQRILLYCTTHWPGYKFDISSPAPTICVTTSVARLQASPCKHGSSTPAVDPFGWTLFEHKVFGKEDWSEVHSIHSFSHLMQITWVRDWTSIQALDWLVGLSQHESMSFPVVGGK